MDLSSWKYAVVLFCFALWQPCPAPAENPNPVAMPKPGYSELQVLSPTFLELILITTKDPNPARVREWDFVDEHYRFNPPKASDFVVIANSRQIPVQKIGFKRRPLYAPLKKRDLRISNHLYLQLSNAIPPGAFVKVLNPGGKLFPTNLVFAATAGLLRWNPAIHVNQEGYLSKFPKKAMVGLYLGTLGELDVAPDTKFQIVEAGSTNAVFKGTLSLRQDRGFESSPRPYQHVFEADFSSFTKPGNYQLFVTGLGTSFPFRVDDGIAALWARTYALGLYHQRCGTSNALPFTRFTHAVCHTRAAEVPNSSFEVVNAVLADMSGNYKNNPKHTAPQLKNTDASLYPFVNTNKLDVTGGHHDAGDYSKYTINSAHLIHCLVFAADAFPGAGELDNLGLPESGDGKSDLLQEAKWEADFLAKLQDADGGFYFLVYPRDRQYEHDVSLVGADCGDAQVVFPKTTAATAAATAALAQIGSSPLFKRQFPDAARVYLQRATNGWAFLQRAISMHGRDGAYQKISHYGDEFMHNDELAWAAAELFGATGDRAYEKELITHFNPTDPNTRRWTWWRMFEAYGNAIRSYAFAARTGRLQTNQLDPRFLGLCEDEIIAAGQDQAKWSRESAYATSFPDHNKRFRNAGWFFSFDRTFDLAVAYQIDYPVLRDPRPAFMDALLGNLNYEGGCNPVNIPWLTGLGWKRQREIVHQYAQNQKRILPPTGLVFASVQEGFAYIDAYKKELGELTFPPDWDTRNPYAFYDRWGDSFNTATEFVSVNLARSLAAAAFLMAQTPLKSQAWRFAPARIEVSGSTARLRAPALDLGNARCVWEFSGTEPLIRTATEPVNLPRNVPWIEAEAWLPDGRRAFATWPEQN